MAFQSCSKDQSMKLTALLFGEKVQEFAVRLPRTTSPLPQSKDSFLSYDAIHCPKTLLFKPVIAPDTTANVIFLYLTALLTNNFVSASSKSFLPPYYTCIPEERKNNCKQLETNPGSLALHATALTTGPWLLGWHSSATAHNFNDCKSLL